MEKAHPRYLRPERPISVSAVPFGPGIDSWRSCRFIGALVRSLCLLPGGLRRFVPCSIGANHCRLRHVEWPTRRLPASGQVSRLVAAYPDSAGDCSGKVFALRVPLVSKSSPVRKRFRLNRKTPAHLVGILAHSRPRVWKRLRQVGFSGLLMPDHVRRRCDHADGGSVHEHDRVGVG